MYDCAWPWYSLMFQWDSLGYCCFGKNKSIGTISQYDAKAGYKSFWNHPLAIEIRETIVKGKTAEYCPPDCIFLKLGSESSLWDLEQYHDRCIAMMEDAGQRVRAAMNLKEAKEAFMRGDTVLESKPVRATIHAGSRCNIACIFCHVIRRTYDPDPKHIINVLDEVHDSLIYVTMTGAEPQVNKAGRALLEACGRGRYKFMVILATNAQWVDWRLIERVPLASVTISTDGATKKTYEKVRVRGDYDDLIRNIKRYAKLGKSRPGMELITNYTICPANYHEIPEALKLYESLGMKVQFNLVVMPPGHEQNIRERFDLHEDLLKKIDMALAATDSFWTRSKLTGVKNTILELNRRRLLLPASKP